MSTPDLSPLFSPRSIAVIGASRQTHKVGGMPIRLLRENGYAGAKYPVHRDATEIQGLRAYPSLLAIDQPVDLAIVAVPAEGCDAAMDQMLASGTRAAVMFSSGFAETSAAGAAAQARIGARARDAGMVLLGPNCLGAMNMREKVFATFSPVALGGAEAGTLALVSQSGAFGGYAFSVARDAGLGFGYWITTGNEAGVQVADAIHWLAQDAATRVILVYIEGCRDEPRLVGALAAARSAGKPVVVVKVGHTPVGARAARLHTASDTGDAAHWDALLSEHGVHRAATLGELFRLGHVLASGRRPQAPVSALAILSISGGVGIMMADRAEWHGLALPSFPEEPTQRLKRAIPFASTANPIDVTGNVFAQPQVLVAALDDAARCGCYGSVVTFLAAAGKAPGVWPALQACVDTLALHPAAAPLMFSGLMSPGQVAWLESRGCMVFAEPAHAIDAVAALARRA